MDSRSGICVSGVSLPPEPSDPLGGANLRKYSLTVAAKLLPVLAVAAVLALSLISPKFQFDPRLVACAGYGPGYGYTAGPPSVTAIGPNNGTDAGGTSVGISGQGFCNLSETVQFGATPATSFGIDSDTHITAVSPAHSPTIVNITVTNTFGTSAINDADQYLYSSLYTMDAFGGIHPDGGSPGILNEPTFGSPLAKAAHQSPGTPGNGLVLDGYGGLHPYGSEPGATNFPYFPGFNIARDFVFNLAGTGGYELDGYGGIHPFAVGSNALPPAAANYPYYPGNDVAKKLTLLASGLGGYELDAYGGIHPWAVGGSPLPVAATGFGYWAGQNNARDLWVDPASTAVSASGYTLDLYGGFHPWWTAGTPIPTAIAINPYWAGNDLARAFWFVPTATPSTATGYVLDAYGGIHPFAAGGQRLPQYIFPFGYWAGQDLARSLFGG